VKIDRLARMFLLRDRAEETARRIHAESPEVAAVADAFCAGVNAFQADGPLPFEFAVLGITPRPFTLADSLTVAAILPITFADALRVDVFSSILRESHPDLPVDLLFPGYALEEAPETIMETPEEAAAWVREHPLPLPGRERTGAASQDTARALTDALLAVNALWGGALGSNSWVLGPSRTASGKPLLANDPHIGFTNPSIWYEAHLTFGDVDNYGLYLPPIPLALIAHTPRLAWGLTMFCNDDIDLFREQFDPADPGRVMHKGEWTAGENGPADHRGPFWPRRPF
jgi:penicillin amidase